MRAMVSKIKVIDFVIFITLYLKYIKKKFYVLKRIIIQIVVICFNVDSFYT